MEMKIELITNQSSEDLGYKYRNIIIYKYKIRKEKVENELGLAKKKNPEREVSSNMPTERRKQRR